MKTILVALAISLPYSACTDVSSHVTRNTHPFIGCWVSMDGLDYEGWSVAPNGWLLGYAMNQNADGDVTFFEQMRIERSEGAPDVLFVSGGNDGTTVRFTRQETNNPFVYHFTNPQHDHPQAITYRPDGTRLDAEIAMMDGSKSMQFPKRACKN